MKRLPSIVLLLLTTTTFPSLVRAQQKYATDPIAAQASEAAKQGKYLESLALYETLEQKYPVQTQDDVNLLIVASDYALKAGDKERAFAICERAMNVPAKEGAQPPGMWPAPLDLRGQVRWQMVRIRRSQGRWDEALALCQLNRQTYPLDDGCVPSGAALQEMAMREGDCLEHLGRFEEAVSLYFTCAWQIDPSVKPEAMRRLFDIYQSANQLEDLKRSMEREKVSFDKRIDQRWEQIDGQNDDRESEKARSPFVMFERVRHFSDVARLHRWNDLIQTLHTSNINGSGDAWNDPEQWNRREAVAALLKLDAPSRNEALHALQDHLKRNPPRENEVPNISIQAVILILQGDKSSVEGEFAIYIERQRTDLLLGASSEEVYVAPRNLALITPDLKLPTVLTAEKSHA